MKKFGSAVILAGGNSSRMGFDKQQVHIGGVSMVNYIAKQLETVFEHIIIVSNTPDYYSPSKYQIIEDIYKNKGPMGGIHVGLLYGKSDYIYVVAGDMPIINCDYINKMKSLINIEINKTKKDVFSCVSRIDGQIEPFNGFYHKKSGNDIIDCIKLDHLKITRLLEERDSMIIPESEVLKFSPNLDMFMNLNTLEKLKTWDKFDDSISIIA